MGKRDEIRAKRLTSKTDVTYAEWIADPERFATREQVVSYAQFQLREQIVPLVADIIKRAIDGHEERKRARRWDRRLWAVIKSLAVRNQMSVADLPEEARAALRQELDQLEQKGPMEAKAATEIREELDRPADKPTSCVVCGGREIQPGERGGWECGKCKAVLVDPPPALKLAEPGPEPVEDSIPGETQG